MPARLSTPGLQKYVELERKTKRERPAKEVRSTLEIADFIHTIRTGLDIRQIDLAVRAQVGRHFLMELETGKQSCSIEMVLRVLETLGFEVTLTPFTPIPPWIEVARHMAKSRRDRIKVLRNQRRNGRRELERHRRLETNSKGKPVDLE